MIVVGGSYDEICRDPDRNELIGSGMRAAAAIRTVDEKVEFLSAIDEASSQDAQYLAAAVGLTPKWVGRTAPVGFSYSTPLSAPTVTGALSRLTEPINIDGAEHALVFGMIEGEATGKVKSLVYDPQKPTDLLPLDIDSFKAERLAIVANTSETRALGGARSTKDAAKRLLLSANADVVVTKQAARGALVTTKETQIRVGPRPTEHVWPIGSGDAFAAGFAWSWLTQDATAEEAARVGSSVAAVACSTERLDLAPTAFTNPSIPELEPQLGRIYLAGPFFDLGQRWLVNLLFSSLKGLGGDVFSPFHHVGLGDHGVAAQDLAGLDDCTAVLALLDGADPGTLFEVGWARHKETPVIGYTLQTERDDFKMLRGTDVQMMDDLSSAAYTALWRSMGAKRAD